MPLLHPSSVPHQFFQLEVYNSDGSRLTESQIHSQLLRIRSQSWKTDKEPVGILTSEHRHTWGEAYNRLLTGSSQRGGASVFSCCTVWNPDGLRQEEPRFQTGWCSFLVTDRCEYWDVCYFSILNAKLSITVFVCVSDKLNRESVRMIERGLFSLCLDSPVMRISDEKYVHTHRIKQLCVYRCYINLQSLCRTLLWILVYVRTHTHTHVSLYFST